MPEIYGDPDGFAFLVDHVTPPIWGTLQIQVAPGHSLGAPDRLTNLLLCASWLEGACETHLAGWPDALAKITTPLESFERVRTIYCYDDDGVAPALSRYLRAFVLTNALGPTLDGTFAVVRPSPSGVWFVWDARDGQGIRVGEVAGSKYRAAVQALYAAHGDEANAAPYRRSWEQARSEL